MIALYTPKHRRNVLPDSAPKARCRSPFGGKRVRCGNSMCPRHYAAAYAEHMALHSTDSIPRLHSTD